MENPASTDDLVARGYALPSGSNVPQTRLDEAWRALQRELRVLGTTAEAALATGWVEPADLVDVVTAAALRVLDNPEGIEEESAQIDDWRESRRRANATRDVYFTAAELRRLTPPMPTAGSMPYTR